MAKGDFYFPLYYKRILTSTIGWRDDEFGAYMRLLIYQFDNGSIPSELSELARIAPSVKKHWPLLSRKFKDNGSGGLVNEVMAGIYEDVQSKKNKNKGNGKLGGRPKKENPNETQTKPNGFKNETQMEPIPIYNSKYKKEKEGGGEVKNLNFPFTDDFKPYWENWKEYKKREFRFTYKSHHSEQAALNSLKKLSKNDLNIAIEILNQSMSNGWQGFFELKNSYTQSNRSAERKMVM